MVTSKKIPCSIFIEFDNVNDFLRHSINGSLPFVGLFHDVHNSEYLICAIYPWSEASLFFQRLASTAFLVPCDMMRQKSFSDRLFVIWLSSRISLIFADSSAAFFNVCYLIVSCVLFDLFVFVLTIHYSLSFCVLSTAFNNFIL